ncbi:hypothetical protein HPB50_005694 [Hyalomma asiaticum]|uniref:Uncharacterized protein n=1 Tax=Hyalomma asiaticum TaxID=266040 RepID=A0ACB7S315_HYAAI|nr:hypothetical protein HPB50_005694 [Hyalomma asiaticum]
MSGVSRKQIVCPDCDTDSSQHGSQVSIDNGSKLIVSHATQPKLKDVSRFEHAVGRACLRRTELTKLSLQAIDDLTSFGMEYALAVAFLPEKCNTTEKLSVTGERIGQHWAYLERYLSVATNAALLRQATGDSDIEELTLRSVNSLLRTLRKSPAIDGSEMELCHKALSTLADMCDDGSSALASSLQAAVVDFVADCLNEIAEQRGVVEYRRLENISSWVGSLASGRTFTLPITKHLLDKLLQFASFINTLKEDQRVLEIEHFDRSFFLLQCTENAVASLKQVTPLDCCELSETAKVLVDFCTKFQARHPLFAGYLFDILKVLKERITICKSNKQPAKKLYTWLEKDVH